MGINIPSSVFDCWNDVIANTLNRTVTLVYPEKKEDCPNCIMSTMGTSNRSISIYQPGGPYPFERGMPCPYCNGAGYKAIENTDTINTRMYWDKKSWVKTGAEIAIPNDGLQTISFMTDLEKVEKCKFMIPDYNGIENYHTSARYEKFSSPIAQGFFKQNTVKYVVTFWTRAKNG